MPSLCSVSAEREPGHALLEEERRDPLVLRRRIGLRKDERVVGDRCVRDPVLRAVEDIDVALAPGGPLHGGDVGARGRLGQPEAGQLLAARLRREPALLLLLGPVAEERERVEPDVDGDQRAERGLAALDLLADERLGDEVEAGAAVLLGNDDSEQPQLGHALDHADVEVVVDVVLDRVRQHALVHEVANRVLDEALLVGELEVHRRESMHRADTIDTQAEPRWRSSRRPRQAGSRSR